MSQFFIDRPVFAWVIAILITLGGVLAIARLPAESYPSIAPPQLTIQARYPGASAETVERTVTQVIEQQLVGIDRLLYFTATSSANGSVNITLTFENNTDIDTAAVQTQNRVTLAEPRLPSDVVQQGVTVGRGNTGFMMVVGLRSADGSVDSNELNNIISSRILDPIQRVQGVGYTYHFGSEFAMRIWLNPDKLRAYGLAAAAVLNTVRSQNVQFAAGSLGEQPAPPEQKTSASVSAENRFSTIEQFENVILRANPNGTTLRLKDVARVELGPAQYGRDSRFDDQPNAGFGVQLLPGANALEVGNRVKAEMTRLQSSFPPGVTWFLPFDSLPFIVASVHDVIVTLVAAVALVFIVMLVFLQSFRATLIPMLVVPAALMGAFIGMYVAGFSINQLSLFGIILAIGIVVDDAIVVIENVERIMREENLPPLEATRKAMGQITGAIVTISVVLAAVFVPAALQTGTVGAIYRQFALTIAISMIFSAFLALIFTPALCATLLKPAHLKPNLIFRGFNRAYDGSQAAYISRVRQAVRHTPRWMIAFALMVVVGGFLFARLPGSFLPEEDQGYALAIVQLPPGSTLNRTMGVMQQVNDILKEHEAVQVVMQVGGFSFIGQSENVGMAFIRLKPWDKRKSKATEFIQWANGKLAADVKDAQVYAVNMPTIRGLGAFGGFSFFLEDRAGLGRDALLEAQQTMLQEAAQSPILANVRSNALAPAPRLDLKLDRVQAQSMGLSISDVYSTVQLMLAPVYVNDFFYQGRVLRVLMQADAPYRMSPDSLDRFYVAATARPGAGSSANSNEMTRGAAVEPPGSATLVPVSSVINGIWTSAPPSLVRYNGFPAVEITGTSAAGHSSGEAMKVLQNLVEEKLPLGFGYDWAGHSLQEIRAGSQAPILFALSILVVYLCLAALYESWATPVAVMLVVPVGVLGAILAVMLRGLPNDVYFKIGLIAIIGLAAKNAILIVEFAVEEQKRGKSLYEAVIEASRLRLRPILMTSFAFILGVLPLAVSTGAGANARHAIATGVIGGMLSAALLGVLMVPIFYVAVRRLLGDPLHAPPLPDKRER